MDKKSDMGFEGLVGTHQEEKEMRAADIKMPLSIMDKQENKKY